MSATSMNVSKDLLLAVLSDDQDWIDLSDAYQCCAFLWLCFECCECGRQELFETAAEEYPSQTWVIQSARIARQTGWHIATWSPEGILNTVAHCPDCTRNGGNHAA